MRQKVWEQKHRLGSFRRKAKLPVRSSSAEAISPAPQEEPQQGLLAIESQSPPPYLSPSYSRRQSVAGRRGSVVGLGKTFNNKKKFSAV